MQFINLVYFYTMVDSDDIYKIIEKRREELGLTQAQVSKLAFNRNDTSAIQNIKRGSSPSVDKLFKICEVLNLECYFGLPRTEAGIVMKIVQDHGEASQVDKILNMETEAGKSILASGDQSVADNAQFTFIPRYDAQLSAGEGVFNEHAEPIDHLAFSHAWMGQHQLSADKAILVSIKGDSMMPTLGTGDLVLIDKKKTNIINGKVYAFNDIDGGSKVKRLEVIPDVAVIIRSDNPEEETIYRKGTDMNIVSKSIIGQVVWSGHNWT
jgi:phage repressor protein C with HTH and peptisase S24 domain